MNREGKNIEEYVGPLKTITLWHPHLARVHPLLLFPSPFLYSEKIIFIDVELFSEWRMRPNTMTIETVDFPYSMLGAYSYQPKIR